MTLKYQDNPYFHFFEFASDGIAIISEKKIVTCNHALVTLFGYENKIDLLDINPAELSAVENSPELNVLQEVDNLLDLCMQNSTYEFEWLCKKADGENFWANIVLTKIVYGDDTYIHALCRDITEKKRLKDELQLQYKQQKKYLIENEQYKDAIETYLIVSKTDLKGRITYANDAFCKISGYSRDELLGKNHNIVRHPDMNVKVFAEIWETILSGNSWKGTIFNRNKKGKKYYVKTVILPIFDNNGAVNSFISIREDVTALVESRNLALEHEKSKDLLLSKMSHELRTPLNGIIGLLNLVFEERSSVEVNKYLNIILKESNALLDLINTILDSAKLRSNHFELASSLTNLYIFIAYEVDFFKPLLKDKAIDFEVDVAYNLPEYVFIDAKRLRQVLHNLIANAIKFTPVKGNIKLRVSYEEELLSFEVIDNGIGIDESVKQKIFDAFTQVHTDSGENTYGGTGLGLNIASLIVSKMGGELNVESEVGKGSRFYFSFIAQNDPSGESIARHLNQKKIYVEGYNERLMHFLNDKHIIYTTVYEQPKSSEVYYYLKVDDEHINLTFCQEKGENSFPCNNLAHVYEYLYQEEFLQQNILLQSTPIPLLKVLVVEDYETNQFYLKTLLEKFGVDVDIAEHGEIALQMIDKNSYDVILSDINMPVMDGVKMAKVLQEQKSEIPIYALTADSNFKKTAQYKKAKFDGILLKPFDQKQLFMILKGVRKREDIDESSITDRQEVLESLNIPEDILIKLYHMYIKNVKKDIEKLQSAYENEDVASIKEIAHKIKGSSGSLQRMKTYDEMTKLQRKISLETMKETPHYIEHLKAEIEALSQEIE